MHTLPKHPPSVDGGSWLTVVENLLLASGIFEGVTLTQNIHLTMFFFPTDHFG